MPRPPLAWPVRKPIVWAVAGVLVVLGIVGVRAWRADPVKTPDDTAIIDTPLIDNEIVELVVSNPGYLGPQACAECHAERVAEFQGTRHFLANCVPSSGILPAGFLPGRGEFQVPGSSLRFEMTASEGRFLQTATRESIPPTPPTAAEIAFIYGAAGGSDEVYFTWHDGRLHELPMVWLSPLDSWGAGPFDPHGSGDFSREMTIRCVECHNTWFEHVPGSRNQYGRDKAVLGVTCEVCHGPGREHVAFHRDHPQTKQPHAVVRPAQLSRERQMDLCAQCHSNALKHRGPAFDYRPGRPLDESYVSLRTRHPEDDHVANQTSYLRQSKCFQKSETLTCVTCHNPHRPRSAANAGAESCRQCHNDQDCRDRNNLPAAVQGDCVGCHMPEHRKIQVSFRTESDQYVAPVKRYEHQIGIHFRARQSVLLEWHRRQPDPGSRDEAARLSKLLAESWRLDCGKRQEEYRYLAAIDACRESLRFEPGTVMREKLQELLRIQEGIDSNYHDAQWHEKEHRYPEAIAAYRKVLADKPDFAMAHARLGTTYAVMGEKQLALSHLESAAALDRDEPYSPAMLGWLMYLDGKPERALEFYRQADDVEPYSAKINHQMGLAFAKLGRWPEAVERHSKAVAIDPKAANSVLELSRVLRRAGKPDDALKYGLRAARLTRFAEPEVLLNLADAYAADGRWDDAVRTAEQSLTVTQARQPLLAPRIRIRLDELRTRRHQRD